MISVFFWICHNPARLWHKDNTFLTYYIFDLTAFSSFSAKLAGQLTSGFACQFAANWCAYSGDKSLFYQNSYIPRKNRSELRCDF